MNIHETLGCGGAVVAGIGGAVAGIVMGFGLGGAVGGIFAGAVAGWVAGVLAGSAILRFGPSVRAPKDDKDDG